MMVSHIDSQSAKKIAEQFLRQHFSIQKIDAMLEDKTWLVSAHVESFDKPRIEKIRIDSASGEILQVTMEEGVA